MELFEVNRMREASYKVPEGKLVKVKLEIIAEKIAEVKILGDFFLHPEEVILDIEKELIGCANDETTIEDIIIQILRESNATLIGAAAADIAQTIIMAWGTG